MSSSTRAVMFHRASARFAPRQGIRAVVGFSDGSRLLAERIKQLARRGGVPIVHDAGLTHALWPLDSGDEIPEALYDSVAELWRVIRTG